MRKKIFLVALTAVALTIIVFGIPLTVLVSRDVVSQERSEIERLALRAAVQISPDDFSGDPVHLPQDSESEPVGLYDVSGRLVHGVGPEMLEPALAPSLQGSIAQVTTDSALVVAVPLSAHEQVFGVVRAASPLSDVGHQVHLEWLVLGMIGVAAAAVAGLIATVQSRRLAAPIQTLQEVATELGNGNLGARAPVSGVAEIDRAGAALNATAARLGALIAREQAFSAHASHQLRTPLTGLRLTLESALQGDREQLEEAARSAIRSADALATTIDDVLSLTRRSIPQGPPVEIADLLRDISGRWAGLLAAQGRGVRLESEDPPATTTPVAAIRQVLDVLIDNAYRHGRGDITMRARASAGALAIDVIDEGPAQPLLPPSDEGLGLALATAIAVGQGGRLVQAVGDETMRMTLLLPSDDA